MNASELRNKDVTAIKEEIAQLLKVHLSLRMKKGTQQLSDHTQLGKTRRAIACAKTILLEKQSAKEAA